MTLAAAAVAVPAAADPWAGYPAPALRHESRHGDRLERCFVDCPASLYAMFAATVVARPQAEAQGRPPDDAAVQRHCAERLADYKVPETWQWRSDPLPRHAHGKLIKRLLRDTLV